MFFFVTLRLRSASVRIRSSLVICLSNRRKGSRCAMCEVADRRDMNTLIGIHIVELLSLRQSSALSKDQSELRNEKIQGSQSQRRTKYLLPTTEQVVLSCAQVLIVWVRLLEILKVNELALSNHHGTLLKRCVTAFALHDMNCVLS